MRCIYCNSNKCPKKGRNGVIQKYYCHSCKKYFQENSREIRDQKLVILDEYIFHKQTYTELNELFSVKKKVVQKIIDDYVLPTKIHNPRPLVLVVDATYFGKRNHSGIWGVLVFKDNITKEILWYKFLDDRETSTDYLEGKLVLLGLGYTILSVTGDGFSGIYEVFKEYPIQFCHFHIKQLVKRYVSFTTKKSSHATA